MSVEQDLIQIMQARYGRDVRQSIHDAIYDINEVAKDAQYHASTSTASAQAYADAALASERAAAEAQAAAEAAAQEAMSGTPAGYADLVALVGDTQVNHATGDSLALVDTVEGDALLQCAFGMSVQNGTPTPSSPVEIKSSKADFKCVGKNLYDINSRNADRTNYDVTCTIDRENQTITFNGTATGDGANPSGNNVLNTDKFIKANVGDKITLSFEVISGTATTIRNFGIYLNMPNANLSATVTTKNLSKGIKGSVTLTVSSDMLTEDGYLMAGSIQRWMSTGDVYNNLVMAWQIERGDTATDWEPYQSVQQSTDLTLRAIEVTSSDSYNLVKDGKYYIADTLEWSEEKGYQITRRIKNVILADVITGWSSSISKTFIASIPDARNDGNFYDALCSKYKCDNTVSLNALTDGQFRQWSSSDKKSFGFHNSAYSSQSDAVAGESDTVFNYILATPYDETITPEQALSLLSLKTYDVATSIDGTGDVAPVIELHYAKSETTAKALTGHNEGYKAQEFEGLYGVKNLIPYPYDYDSQVINGVTFTVNSDNSVTANGTATAQILFRISLRGTSSAINIDKKQAYRLTGCPYGGSPTTYSLNMNTYIRGTTTAKYQMVDTGKGDTYVYDDDVEGGVYIYIASGTTANNLVFKPMLRLATIQDDSYTEYAMSNLELTKKVLDLINRVTTLEG